MRKVCKISVCVLLIFAFACFCAIGLVACNTQLPNSLDMVEGSAPTSLPNRISADDNAVIAAGMAEGADREAVSNAVIRLYNIANESRIQNGTSLMLQESTMWLGGVGKNTTVENIRPMGVVQMRGFTLRTGAEWYNEFVAQVIPGQGVSELMSFFSTMVKINYHTNSEPDAYYFNIMKGESLKSDCTLERFPYESYLLIQPATKYDLQGFKDAANVLDAPNEIYNMEFVPEIIAEDATISHEDGAYKVHFTVDMTADPELLQEWYRLPQKDMSEGGQTIKKYIRYVCDFEVWDNGYAKTYSAEYARDAGFGSGITRDKFNYLWNRREIMAIISDDYRMDDMDVANKLMFNDPGDYIEYYISADIVAAKMPSLYIALIVIGCLAFVAIVARIVVEVLVRKGKLPKLAARRKAKKQKRAAKKLAKKEKSQGYGTPAPEGREDMNATSASEENADGKEADDDHVDDGRPADSD